jgi:hypothetical protein
LVPTVSGGDGRLEIAKADDIGFQPFLSLNVRLTDALLLRIVYRAEMDVELSGDVKVTRSSSCPAPIHGSTTSISASRWAVPCIWWATRPSTRPHRVSA